MVATAKCKGFHEFGMSPCNCDKALCAAPDNILTVREATYWSLLGLTRSHNEIQCFVDLKDRSRLSAASEPHCTTPDIYTNAMKANAACHSCAGRSVARPAVRVCTSSSSSRRVTCRAAAPVAAPAQVDAAAFEQFLLAAQQQILSEAEQLDGSGQKFIHDRWERPGDNAGEWGWLQKHRKG